MGKGSRGKSLNKEIVIARKLRSNCTSAISGYLMRLPRRFAPRNDVKTEWRQK
ncbi:hypothetical protein RFEPED_0095 [Rickettsia felis str. Pedreira]|uniref:Uncharacterized protein n=1 Tax=Rickettsia felis str. Pedreira TaxID=1359196 RepID=A0A0F3MT12_RICFI|nr:hypothetical protein [Rickettsia felis]KJV57729.1 hypothetical protein RFEPED_0095 [Rickettsia felis str. Pedreira]